MLSQRFVELLRFVTSSSASRTIYFPYDISAVTGIIGRLPTVFGRAAPAGMGGAGGGATARLIEVDEEEDGGGGGGGGGGGDEFGDLS